MNLDEIAVFVDVVRAGSVSAAARRARVPKSTISRAVARLEARLGTVLLRRLPRGELLTEAGTALVTQAAPHIDALQSVSVSDDSDEPVGRLRITAPNDFGREFLGEALVAFARRYPRLNIELDLTTRMVDLIGEGFDVALRVTNANLLRSALVAYALADLNVQLFVAPAFVREHGPITSTKSLREHEIHNRLTGVGPRQFSISNGTRTAKFRGTLPLVGNDIFFLRDVIVAGAAVGLLPSYVARPEVEAGRLLLVLPNYRIRDVTVFFVHAPLSPVPKKIRLLREFITPLAAKVFAAHAAQGG